MRYLLVILMLVFAQAANASPLGNTYLVQVKGTDTTIFASDKAPERGDIALLAYFYLSSDGTFYFQDARSKRISKGGVVAQSGGEACAKDRGNASVTRCYAVKVSGNTISINANVNRDWYGKGSVEQWVFTVRVSGGKCSVSSVKYTFVYKPKPGREADGFWGQNPKYASRQCSLTEGPFPT